MSLSDFQCFSSQKLTNPGGMNWRGAWNIANAYQYSDVVQAPDGEGYVCIDLDGNVGSTPGTAPAVWTLLSSGTATAVSLSSANGSGITVAEPTANNFTVATNLVAGSGISLTPSGINTSLTVGNSGVLSVSAGTGISVGGTAQNPSITNGGVLSVGAGSGISIGGTAQNPTVAVANNTSQSNLQPGAQPGATCVGIGTSVPLSFPTEGPGTTIPVAAGGLYCFQGCYNMTTTNLAAFAITFAIENGATDVVIVAPPNTEYIPGAPLSGVDIPFCAFFIAAGTTIGMRLAHSVTATAGDTTTIGLQPCYLTRIS